MTTRGARLAIVVGLAWAVGGCAAPASPPGGAWTMSQVEQPGSVTGAPSSYFEHCSPCHPDATLGFAGVSAPSGLVAFGLLEPPPRAAAWSSRDGTSWTVVSDFPAPPASVVLGATSASGRIVAVGADSGGARSWASVDGRSWTISDPSPSTAGPDASTRMVAVVTWDGALLAAGQADRPSENRTSAAVWTGSDGLHWVRLPDSQVFEGGHIAALAAGVGRIVAVGPAASQTEGGSAAWTSTDGRAWVRSRAPDLGLGVMRGVAATASGFVAVGLRATDDGAMAWTSADGLTWTAHDGGDAFTNDGQPVRAVAVTTVEAQLVAVGWKSDGGNGSAVVWRSEDGATWRRDAALPAFSGAEMAAVLLSGSILVAVGTSGYPDNDQATIWLAPGGR